MEIKKIISLSLGAGGFLMAFFSLAQGAITGAVIGTNTVSRFVGVFGVVLMILAIFIERHEMEKKK